MTALKIVLYLFGGLLTAPGTLLAFFIWNVDQAARQKGLLEFLWFAFWRFLELFQWLFAIVIPVLILWLVLAFLPKYRVIGESGDGSGWSRLDRYDDGDRRAAEASSLRWEFPCCRWRGVALNLWLIWQELLSGKGS